jgi:tyrosinase
MYRLSFQLWFVCTLVFVNLSNALGQAQVEIYINGRGPSGENDLTDDYVTWSPTLCEARVVGLPMGSPSLIAHIMNDPSVDQIVPASPPLAIPAQTVNNPPRYAGGRVLFAEEPATGWPSKATATQSSLILTLPADGDFIRFRIAGQFGRASYNDKDVILRVHENNSSGTVVGSHRLMVRVRKNANRLHDFEIKRFLDAMRAYKDLATGRNFEQNAEIHRLSFDADNEAHTTSLVQLQPSFFPWHRAYLLQVERDLQKINGGAYRGVTLPYWNWDEATPRVWADWFMGAPGNTPDFAGDVIFHPDNPFDGWITALGVPIQRRTVANFDVTARPPDAPGIFVPALKPDPAATPSVISLSTFRGTGSDWDLITLLELAIHNPAHSLNCGSGQISGGNSADDPLFYLLHCQIDREWAAWQNYKNRFGTGPDDYDLSEGPKYDPATSTLQYGSHLEDEIWPWDLTGGPNADPGKSRPQAMGGKFSGSAIRNLWPSVDARPTNEDMIDYEGRANPIMGLGFCYDDVPYGRGPNVGPNQEGVLLRCRTAASQHRGVAFNVVVEAIDAVGNIRTSFQGRVRLVQEDATIGATMPNSGVHINGTAATDDDFHDFVLGDAGTHTFSVIDHTAEIIPRFKAFADNGGIPGESNTVTVQP